MVYTTIQDVIEQFVEPSLGDYVDDYDVESIAKEITYWHARKNGFAIKPVYNPDSDEHNPNLWDDLLDAYDKGYRDDES